MSDPSQRSDQPQPGQAYAAPPYPGQPQPGQPYPQVPPAAGPPQQPAPRSWFARHKVLTTIGAVLAVVVVASALGGGGDGSPTAAPEATEVAAGGSAAAPDASPAADAPAEEVAAGLGTAVRDGKFEFVVTQVDPGVAQVGDAVLGTTAQGQFVLVHLTVTNIGTEAQYFDGSSQTLVDTLERQHSADTTAAIYLGDANSFLNQINPGNTVEGVVVFDIPADAVPASLELHDSAFSGGVAVQLG